MNDILPVLDTDAPGFSKILENDRWTLAMILDSEPMHLENVTVISRHIETDEVFVLLEGDACIYAGVGETVPITLRRISLQKNKAFVVKAGTWHATIPQSGCKILVVENSGTGSSNTEKMPVTQAIFTG